MLRDEALLKSRRVSSTAVAHPRRKTARWYTACYQLGPSPRLHRPEHHSRTKFKHTNQLAQALFEYLCHRVVKLLLAEPQAACLSPIAIGPITLSAARADVTVAADFDKIARISRSHTREECVHALEFVRSAAKTV